MGRQKPRPGKRGFRHWKREINDQNQRRAERPKNQKKQEGLAHWYAQLKKFEGMTQTRLGAHRSYVLKAGRLTEDMRKRIAAMQLEEYRDYLIKYAEEHIRRFGGEL